MGKYLKKCINRQNIQLLQNELTKFYFDRGYSNARIYFDFKTNGLTENEMSTLFDKDLGKVKDLIGLIATRRYTQNQTDAVGSAIFNLGPSFFIYGYDKSTESKGQYDMNYIKEALKTSPSKTPRIINNENSSEQIIQKQFEKYNYTGGQENKIIKKRRYNESVVYNKGNYDINKDKEKSMNYYGKRRLVYGEKK